MMRGSDWIQIFKAGAYPGKMPVTAEDLETMARGYDPRRHEAPLVLGHPEGDAPALGWVERLRRVGDTLWARVRQVTPELRRAVREGRFTKISMAVYPQFAGSGGMYLRHVGFLGAEVPAVKGMAPIRWADGEFEAHELDLPIAEALDRQHAVMRVLDGCYLLMDRVHAILDDEAVADPQVAILDQVDSLRSLIAAETFTEGNGGILMNFWDKLKALFREAGIAVPEAGAAPAPDPKPPAPVFSEADVQAREAAAAAKAKVEADQAVAAARRTAEVKAEATAFVEAGIRAGKILPAWRETVQPILERGDAAAADVRKLLEGLPKLVEFAEIAPAAGQDPEAGLKAEFGAHEKIHAALGVTFEAWKGHRAAAAKG